MIACLHDLENESIKVIRFVNQIWFVLLGILTRIKGRSRKVYVGNCLYDLLQRRNG
jgi:hypothetical protein